MKMKKLLVAAACLPLALMAQEDRYAQITNPRLTSINKEQPRSTFTSYTNEADAVINDRKNGTFRISLNGKWKFNYVENFADRPTDFMSPHTDVSKWPDINVSRQLGTARLRHAYLRQPVVRVLFPRLRPLLGQAQSALRSQRVEPYGNLPPHLHAACRLG